MFRWMDDWKNTIATGLFFISLFWLHLLTGFPPLGFLPVVFSVWASVLLLLAMVQRFLAIKRKPAKRKQITVMVRLDCGCTVTTNQPQFIQALIYDPKSPLAEHIAAGCQPCEYFFKGDVTQLEVSGFLPDGEFDVIPHDDGLIFRVR